MARASQSTKEAEEKREDRERRYFKYTAAARPVQIKSTVQLDSELAELCKKRDELEDAIRTASKNRDLVEMYSHEVYIKKFFLCDGLGENMEILNLLQKIKDKSRDETERDDEFVLRVMHLVGTKEEIVSAIPSLIKRLEEVKADLED